MNSSELKSIAALPACRGVRRVSLATGLITALFTGGLPLIGAHPLVMGRFVMVPAVLALVLHLVLALCYGAVFALALVRSRNGWTFLVAVCTTLLLYGANFILFRGVGPASLPMEIDALLAHVIFGFAFTALFKLAEIGVPNEPPAPSLR